jgi:hypothetical protein
MWIWAELVIVFGEGNFLYVFSGGLPSDLAAISAGVIFPKLE